MCRRVFRDLGVGGRMNALGISVFYGATDHAIAIAEVVTLKLDVSRLEVHHVDGVTFLTEFHQVHRHRIEKRPTPF